MLPCVSGLKTRHWSADLLCIKSVLGLCVCDNRDGCLVAWGLCGCMLSRFSTVWLLPFTLLYLLGDIAAESGRIPKGAFVLRAMP